MNDIQQLTRGWRKLEKGEMVRAGDCFIATYATYPYLAPCMGRIGHACPEHDQIYRRTDADLIAMLSRASMWIRTAGEHGFADEILDLIKERT